MQDLPRLKTSCLEEIGGDSRSTTLQTKEYGNREIITSGESPVTVAVKRDTWLIPVHRNNSSHESNISGNHDPDPVARAKVKSKKTMSKYEQSVTIAPQNKELKIGSPTSQMSRMMSKSLSCNRYWEEEMDRIFKVLEPDGLGKSYSL